MLLSRQSVLSGVFNSSSLASTSLKQSHTILTLSNYGVLLTDDSSKSNIQSTCSVMDMDPSNDVRIVLGGHKCHNWTRKRILHNYKAIQFAKHI